MKITKSQIQKLRIILSDVWAIRETELFEIIDRFSLIQATAPEGGLPARARRELEEMEAQVETARTAGGRAIGILPIYGSIRQHADIFTLFFGGATTDVLSKRLQELVADPNIAQIVLDIDSPGGGVEGITEFAAQLFQARKHKPIVAVVNSLAASAAYWIAAQASEIVVTPSGQVGSIGVIAIHQDFSKKLEQEGIKPTLITAGKRKGEGNPFEPLSEEAEANIQKLVDDFFSMFVKDVARGRGVKVSEARNGFGQGGVVGAQEAVDLGMADRIASLDDTLMRLTRRRGGSQIPSANRVAVGTYPGASMAAVEFGGTCIAATVNTGTIPERGWRRTAQAQNTVAKSSGFGIDSRRRRWRIEEPDIFSTKSTDRVKGRSLGPRQRRARWQACEQQNREDRWKQKN